MLGTSLGGRGGAGRAPVARRARPPEDPAGGLYPYLLFTLLLKSKGEESPAKPDTWVIPITLTFLLIICADILTHPMLRVR